MIAVKKRRPNLEFAMKINGGYECPACGHQPRLSLADRPEPDELIIECEGYRYQGADGEFDPNSENP